MQPTSPVTHDRSRLVRFFRDPRTGEVVVIQAPNAPLWVFLIATVVRRALHPEGDVGTVISIVSGGAIVIWSLLEITGGRSPFRRVLGAVVLLVVLGGLVMR